MVQPLVESVRTEGETSVFVIDGEVVSQAQKVPAVGEIRVHEMYGGTTVAVPLSDEAADLARRTVEAAEAILGERLDYARVDQMRLADGTLAVSELEVTEPGLYLEVLPGERGRLRRPGGRTSRQPLKGTPVPGQVVRNNDRGLPVAAEHRHHQDQGCPDRHPPERRGHRGRWRLAKRLSSRDLMGFGIGIVIGTGIFVLTGVEAKNHAGPAITISFVIAGVVAMLAALCYAELAAAVPTAGSSYTYAYTTIGEVFAWIIGWDLILEFALGAATVARGWSGYLQDALGLPTSLFGEDAPVNLGAIDHRGGPGRHRRGRHPRVEVGHQRPGADQGQHHRVRDRRRALLLQGLEPDPVLPGEQARQDGRGRGRPAAVAVRHAVPTRRRSA